MATEGGEPVPADPHRRKRDMLANYYGQNAEEKGKEANNSLDPLDINGATFKPDIYLTKLLRERSLTELMDKETEMVRHIRSLDSDMQTLVYENYNKFISATDTIRKMKNDFRKMEDEMDLLATNMSTITEFSGRISDTLQDRREQITKLSGVHTLLKKLQFLFELPARLNKCIEMEAYSQAVRYYTKAQKVLHQYQHMPSFQGIQSDCNVIVGQLSVKLRQQFRKKDSSPKQLAECVDLLLQLNEPAEELCEEFLSHSSRRVDCYIAMLELQLLMREGKEIPERVFLRLPEDRGDGEEDIEKEASLQDDNEEHGEEEEERRHDTESDKTVIDGYPEENNPFSDQETIYQELPDNEVYNPSREHKEIDEVDDSARQKIDEDLGMLEKQLHLQAGEAVQPELEEDGRPAEAFLKTPMDILEYVDSGCNGFLSNICLVIASYNDMFLNRSQDHEQLDAIAVKKLVNFVNSLMEQYFSYVQRRVQLEKETGDNTILVRALDRFHRRLQAMNKLLPDTDFSRAGTDIVAKAARDRVEHYLHSLKQHFSDCLTDIRQNLAAPRLVGKQEGGQPNLQDLLSNMHTSITEQVKSVLSNLQAFIASDITFAMKPHFRGPFCTQDVREGLVVAFLKHIFTTCNEFCEGLAEKGSAPPALLLILSRLSNDLEQSTITYLLTLTDEQFMVVDKAQVTPCSELCAEAKSSAQRLLNHYVRVQGLTISQMLRKSVETRDWLNTIEPRNVRAVMKRVVEDITAIDAQVGQLYEEGVRKERSSDSTKRSMSYSTSRTQPRSQWSYTPSTIDNSLMSNIQKLFSERIDIFSAVEFSKVSVLTGIIKISLKTFLECVRLRTFGRFGLQQIQVDTHYLQLYLWRFVSDENLVHFLLDEIVGSTVHRCLDAVTMEPSDAFIYYRDQSFPFEIDGCGVDLRAWLNIEDRPPVLRNHPGVIIPPSEPGFCGHYGKVTENLIFVPQP